MNEYVAAGILAALVVLVFAAMAAGWRARRKRDRSTVAGYPAGETGEPLASIAAFYVATTEHDKPMQRRAIGALGFRARARLIVTTTGLTVAIPGETEVRVPSSAIRQVATATVAIDRVVEPGGLVAVSWQLAGDDEDVVDSYFRVIDPADRVRLIETVASLAGGDTETAAKREG